MKVEVWSDFVCPFCYIGKRRLEEALSSFPHRNEVEIEFKSYELDPNSPKENDRSIDEVIAGKYGISVEEAKKANADIGAQAESVGLKFNFESMTPTNTFDAHRLAHFAKGKGKAAKLTETLLRGYFSEGKKMSDHPTLLAAAVEAGLDEEEAAAVLQDEKAFADDVRYDERTAGEMGVRGVPFFVFNQKYAISGAQPVSTFKQALEKVWEEEKPASKLQDLTGGGDGGACADGHCDIPQDK